MIAEIDKNNDGKVDFEEFLLLMCKQEKQAEDEEEELVLVFKQFAERNEEKGAWLMSPEILQKRFAEIGDPISLQVAQDMIKINDADGDGNFNFAEFLQLLMYDTEGLKEEKDQDDDYFDDK